ncbi:hypothetical protein LAV73_01235 [Lysinibacillus xylanilyticus]|nr:hypothetical protein [Lysinibacillus xylanilyticus]MEB2278629.1 hypothetical protein [Lysinibacillus xylanilyticus]
MKIRATERRVEVTDRESRATERRVEMTDRAAEVTDENQSDGKKSRSDG